MDYKNGRGLVEASSPQLASYLGGGREWKGRNYDTYRVTVIQPHAHHAEGHIRSKEYTEEELDAFLADYREKAERVDVASQDFEMLRLKDWQNKYLSAGDHCTFCPCSATCPKRFERTMEQLTADVPPEPENLVLKDIKIEGIDYAINLLRYKKEIEKHLSDAEDFLKAALKVPGVSIPGVTMEPARGKNAWIPGLTDAQIVKLCGKYGLTKAQLFNTKLITGPQAIDLLERDQQAAFKDELIQYAPGAPKVVLK